MRQGLAWVCSGALVAWFVACSGETGPADAPSANVPAPGGPATPGSGAGGEESVVASGPRGAGGTGAGAGGADPATGGTGGGTGGAGGGGVEPAKPVLVAFLGDSGNGPAFKRVLDLVKAEKANAVVHNGDFDYQLDPDAFFATVDGKLGKTFPYFASVGNHDASAWADYSAYLRAHMNKVGVKLDEPNMADQKFSFRYAGIHFVFVGENGKNAIFADYIAKQFAGPADGWRVCGWHKNQREMQIGGKTDEMGWGVYENCRKAGAIVTTGHEHSYERTKTLVSMQNQEVDPTCKDPKSVCVSKGRTFAIVSGLGGVGIRDQNRCLPAKPPYGCKGEWASIYAKNQNATYGALFIRFNAGGDPNKARGYFKNVDGEVVDEFTITRN